MRVHAFLAVLACAVCVSAQLWASQIAIIDSGVDYKHHDLAAKMWHNPNETADNGKDDDNNGYTDDILGWNFADSNNQIIDYKYLGTFSPDCEKFFTVQGRILTGVATQEEKDWYKAKVSDENFIKELEKFGNFVHGTHVSGIASKNVDPAAIVGMKIIPTEQPGIKTVATAQKMMRLQGLQPSEANNPLVMLYLGYAAKQNAQLLITVGKYTNSVGAKVANCSFGTSVNAAKPTIAAMLKSLLGRDPTDQEAQDYTVYFIQQLISYSKDFVTAAPNTLYVFAAGNDGTSNDDLPASPANIKTDNTISVAATWGTAKLATFSNYGQLVDVAAPGVVINSTIPGDKYMELSGTSMAAPYVTGVAAEVKNSNDALTPANVKQILMETVDVKDFLNGKVKTSGIVNAERAVRAAQLSTNMSLADAIKKARTEITDSQKAFDIEEPEEGVQSMPVTVLPLPNPLM